MKKTKKITPTEFYRNPSQSFSYVKEGGTVYISYKNLKEPIAVMTGYDEYQKLKKGKVDRLKLLENYKFKAKKYKSGTELQDTVRE